jgi:hypothetical protein
MGIADEYGAGVRGQHVRSLLLFIGVLLLPERKLVFGNPAILAACKHYEARKACFVGQEAA